ncbi:MAG: hypothetical protein J07HB67_02574 [halophilic archaeon J07HB67]|jgi:Protein of unknown function (DUF456).|nr:MAG: hypothetical protein J07HB67_02574 [halophilic archaeon J07HB67]
MLTLLGLGPIGLLAVALLVAGVVGSLVPLAPGALLSLGGVYLFWWHSGFTHPGLVALVALTLVGVVTLLVDWFGGAIAAGAGGASTLTSVLAGGVGVVALFVAGPLGILIGVAGTVFVFEYARGDDAETSARAALYATVGMLASNLVQAALTFGMLVGFLFTLLV